MRFSVCRVAYQLIFSHKATADYFNGAVEPFATLLIGGQHLILQVCEAPRENIAPEFHIGVGRYEVFERDR